MTNEQAGLSRLIEQLSADIRELERLETQNRTAQARIDAGATDELDWAALGYTIHNIYGLIENYFLRIAKFFGNDLDREQWHRSLLERMSIPVPGVRPPVITRDQMYHLDDLRRFRHAFRNLYQAPLDPEKLQVVQRRVPGALQEIRASHHTFATTLSQARDALAAEQGPND
jgi:hypothetical protein